jgi:hypothetical protein
VRHRIKARRANQASPPVIDRDEAAVSSFLSDAAHVPGGFAAGVAFPRNERRSRLSSRMRRVCCRLAHSHR